MKGKEQLNQLIHVFLSFLKDYKGINQKLREFRTTNLKIHLKMPSRTRDIFEIVQLKVVTELHFSQFSEMDHI